MAQIRNDSLSPVLVVGGAGFIGSHTVDALLAQGCRVRVFDNLSTGVVENLPFHANLQLRVGDICEPETVNAAMQGMRSCIHLAAQVSAPRSVDDPRGSALCNIVGFINVLEAVRWHKVPRLVYASSAAVYGDSDNLPLDEEQILLPTNPYGIEKQVDELYAALYSRLHGVSSLGLRYFNVYGPRQSPGSAYSGVISKFVERLAAGAAPAVYGDGLQTRDFVYVTDVAAANVLALKSDYCGVCNVATGSRVDLLHLIDVLDKRLDSGTVPDFLPARTGDIRHSCGNGERLRRQLGFSPHQPLEDGLADLVNYVLQNNRIIRHKPMPMAKGGHRATRH